MSENEGFDPEAILTIFRKSDGFDKVWRDVKVLSLGNGKLKAEMKITGDHVNVMGGLHGGFSATLVDVLSMGALLTVTKTRNLTVDLNISFVEGARAGDEITIDVDVLKKKKNLAFLQVEIRNKNTGSILVKGSQTLFLIPRKSNL